MKKKNFCTVLALAFFIMGAVRVSAQVTIGGNKSPETFSQLEIVSGNKTGLRLPQITTTAQRDAMFTNAAGFKTNPLSKGLQIFNEETGCVETWNGTKWIRWCDDTTGGEGSTPVICKVQSTLTDPPYNGWISFMNYNLGAEENVQTMTAEEQAAHDTPEDNYGDLYQWGRVADGHQVRTSETVSGAATAFDANSQASASTHKGKFIIATDWHSPQNDNLWNFSTYPANNPCPAGWRVPTTTELQSIANGSTSTFSGGSTSAGNYWKWNSGGTPGWLIYPNTTGSGAPTLFLPAAGYRNYSNGSLTNVGSTGYYCSSSVNSSTYAYYLYFLSSTVFPGPNGNRGNSFSVRCVAE